MVMYDVIADSVAIATEWVWAIRDKVLPKVGLSHSVIQVTN